jgi:hypothetical protein
MARQPLVTQGLFIVKHQDHTVGFESAIPASERPQTHTLVSAATGIGLEIFTAITCTDRHYKKYLLEQIERNSAAEGVIVVDNSSYQNTDIQKASVSNSEEMGRESDCSEKKFHFVLE